MTHEHLPRCDCDECLPGVPAPAPTLHSTEPAELPLWRRRSTPNFDKWQEERNEQAQRERELVEEFPDPEARRRAANARAYAVRKQLDWPLDV